MINEYKFKDLFIGKKINFNFIVNEEKMMKFMEISEDINPLHSNKDFAINHGFNDRVVYGMLTASIISTVGGVYLPGKYCLIQEVTIKFNRPVYVNEVLTVEGIVEELIDEVQRATIKTIVRNTKNEIVMKAKLYVGFLEK